VLTLTIAIGPDDERTRVSRLVLDVFGDVFVVLPRGVSILRKQSSNVSDITYIWDYRQHRGVKQTVGWWIFPLLVFPRKLHGREVALDGGHGHRAVPPWRAKVIVKRVVFDVFIACVALGRR
jgi:hypothetical protein